MVHLSLEKAPGNPLIHQIYHQLRRQILQGDLPAGAKLPSSRELALDLSLSRNTVLEAYDMLSAEGFLLSVPGSGIFVAPGAADDNPPEPIRSDEFTAFTSVRPIPAGSINFHSGTPALEFFPRAKWGREMLRTFYEAPLGALGYDHPQGRPELRNALAIFLRKSRGIRCLPEQIIITSGAKQALTLVAKCLLPPDSEAWLEDPVNRNVRQIFAYHSRRLLPVPVDGEGIRTDHCLQEGKPVLIYLTPSHQYPLGGFLSIQRRLELIRLARRTGCYLVEDDYDSEFRYSGLPLSSLQELDGDRVIYIGTFSKTLFPSLRLGYLILPEHLVAGFTEWKRLGDHHSASLNQLTLLRFLENGGFERHIARMKKVYRKRRDALIRVLDSNFGDKVKVLGAEAGMHLVAEFPEVNFTPERVRRMNEAGIIASAVAEHSLFPEQHQNQLILGYAHLSESEIAQGIARLQKVIATGGD